MTYESELKTVQAEQNKLKRRIKRWRFLAVGLLAFFIISAIGQVEDVRLANTPYIASVPITGIIEEDKYRAEVLAKLADDGQAKAVILDINSPGGTLVGGESLYNEIRQIAKEKPVVAVLGTIGTSAAYLAASASDRIFSYKGTLTGSIGVLLQTAEVTKLADKIGVNLQVMKSVPLKGAPSLMEAMEPEAKTMLQEVINNSHDYFVDIVKERRNLTDVELREVADGRVLTGAQAVEKKLVDEIGGQEEALVWLKENNKIDKMLEIRDIKLHREKGTIEKLLYGIAGQDNYLTKTLFMQGLVSVWYGTAY